MRRVCFGVTRDHPKHPFSAPLRHFFATRGVFGELTRLPHYYEAALGGVRGRCERETWGTFGVHSRGSLLLFSGLCCASLGSAQITHTLSIDISMPLSRSLCVCPGCIAGKRSLLLQCADAYTIFCVGWWCSCTHIHTHPSVGLSCPPIRRTHSTARVGKESAMVVALLRGKMGVLGIGAGVSSVCMRGTQCVFVHSHHSSHSRSHSFSH